MKLDLLTRWLIGGGIVGIAAGAYWAAALHEGLAVPFEVSTLLETLPLCMGLAFLLAFLGYGINSGLLKLICRMKTQREIERGVGR